MRRAGSRFCAALGDACCATRLNQPRSFKLFTTTNAARVTATERSLQQPEAFASGLGKKASTSSIRGLPGIPTQLHVVCVYAFGCVRLSGRRRVVGDWGIGLRARCVSVCRHVLQRGENPAVPWKSCVRVKTLLFSAKEITVDGQRSPGTAEVCGFMSVMWYDDTRILQPTPLKAVSGTNTADVSNALIA